MEPIIATSARRLIAAVDAAPVWARLLFASAWFALCMAVIAARESETAYSVIASATRVLEQAGLSATVVGSAAFLLWSAIPVALYAGVYGLEHRARPQGHLMWLSLPFFGPAMFGHLSRYETRDVFSPAVALVYDLLMSWFFISLITGLAAYGLFRLVKWFVDDERRARGSA